MEFVFGRGPDYGFSLAMDAGRQLGPPVARRSGYEQDSPPFLGALLDQAIDEQGHRIGTGFCVVDHDQQRLGHGGKAREGIRQSL